MGEVAKFYSLSVELREDYLLQYEGTEGVEYMIKLYIHPKHPTKTFENLGSNYYVFYKVLYQIWL